MAAKLIDEKEVFNRARQIAAPQERLAYMQKACGQDLAAMHRIAELLRVHDQERGFLESSPRPDVGTTAEPITERPGTAIGPYKLLEQIGEGGFGVVFMAEQQQPVRRKVALKVLKPGMDTRQVVARFEAERQALALMDHPNIAHVFDGGETAAGRPYFVMELVRGVPITEFCDQNHLPVRARLELFKSVCQAVQHAHQKGIIHRDLKPTNVLVTLHDDKAVAKVIDFGIAKATGQQLTEKTLFTNFAQMIGTPLYMSPEQAQMSGLDVDTRSDIHALGVMLYELLTGTTPFDKARLKTMGYDEIRRVIREEEPAKPSTRISTLGQAGTTASANRKSDPKRLSQLCRGELDWIVMKCLEKDRNRRYDTANGLAMDLQRYLADEPVQACPPSASYRLRKFARKYRTPLWIGAAFVVLLLLGAAVSTWQAVRATWAERQAMTQRDRAEASFRMARDAVDRLFTQVSQSPKLKAFGMEKFRKDLLQSAREFHERFIREQFDTPGVRYNLALAYNRLTDINRELGDSAAAEEASSRATALLQQLAAGQPHVPEYRCDLAASHAALGRVYMNTASWDKADAAYRQALAIQENQARANPSVAEYQYALAQTCSDLGVVHSRQDHPDSAATMCRRAQETLNRLLEANKETPRVSQYMALLAATQRNLGEVYLIGGLLDKAETALKEAQSLYERLATSQDLPEYWQALARSSTQLGEVYKNQPATLDEAERVQRKALAIFEKLVEEHKEVPEYAYDRGRCYSSMAQTADRVERFEVALARYDKSIEIMEELLGKGFFRARPALCDSRVNRAITLAKKGDHARATGEAEAVARQKDLQSVQIYNIACAFSLASAAAKRDPNLSPTERMHLTVLYADRGADFLRQAIAKGYVHLAVMKSDPDLRPLQGRADFKKLLADLETKTKE